MNPERKHFTPEQANRMLPYVRRIVDDIVGQFRRWSERVREYEVVTVNSTAERPDARALELEREMQQLAAEIEGYKAELAQLGVEFKDYSLGLVDFPARIGGRTVYLCWRLGEPSVRFWHELDSGYRGRRPLASDALGVGS